MYKVFTLCALLAALAGCASNPLEPAISGDNPEDAIQTATGAARSANTDKEIDVKIGASQEGNVTQHSSNVRAIDETQATTSGHIQTIGFAGIGNAAELMKSDPVLRSITLEMNKLLAASELDTVRIDKLRADMVKQSERLMASMATTTPSFDGLKTIIAVFSMDNQTGFTKLPLTDAAAQSKADAFKTALSELAGVAITKEAEDPENP